MRLLVRFLRDLQDGFVLVLTLILLPAFLGITLMMIDVSRVSNAHADLQAIADAAALAGGRELDGSPAAIANARLAMAEITNSVSMLTTGGDDLHQQITFSTAAGNEITAIFLDEVPEQDTVPIDQAWINAHFVPDDEAENAAYIHVHVQSNDFQPLFGFLNDSINDLPVGAIAVAKSVTAACNVPPLYMCNPFEFEDGDYSADGFREAFRRGEFHGKMIKLHPRGNDAASPGNFGFLQVTGNNDNSSASADAIRDIFAGARNPTCYDAETVTTKPGAATSIRQGINVKFDIYQGNFSNWDNTPQGGGGNNFIITPAMNVRKGYAAPATGNSAICNHEKAPAALGIGFPDDPTMSPPSQGDLGAAIGNGTWNLDQYLANNYNLTAGQVTTVRNAIVDWGDDLNALGQTNSAFPLLQPSRYDVYRAEQIVEHPSTPGVPLYLYENSAGEAGEALCAADKPANRDIVPVTDPDPRVTFAAVIDCTTNADQGGGVNTYPVNSFVSVFMTRPMEQNGSIDSTIDLEIIDVTGSQGIGTLDDFVRTEAVLIR